MSTIAVTGRILSQGQLGFALIEQFRDEMKPLSACALHHHNATRVETAFHLAGLTVDSIHGKSPIGRRVNRSRQLKPADLAEGTKQ
jgi:hypothetical protein